MMHKAETIAELNSFLSPIRKHNHCIALVPTMGSLHEGHLSLIKKARQHADFIVVSIFINKNQFVAGEDFELYPRTLAADLIKLQELDVDLVFCPETKELYPDNGLMRTKVSVPELASIHCGKSRPGHFDGVSTVVTKLFNIVRPDVAVFGEKDAQQLLIIKRLVKDLNFPIDIISAPIVREKNGLAISSRNQYLSETEWESSGKLFEMLNLVATELRNNNKNYLYLENMAISELKKKYFIPEYVAICDADTLKKPINHKLIVIAAAKLGETRLIDNIAVQIYN